MGWFIAKGTMLNSEASLLSVWIFGEDKHNLLFPNISLSSETAKVLVSNINN